MATYVKWKKLQGGMEWKLGDPVQRFASVHRGQHARDTNLKNDLVRSLASIRGVSKVKLPCNTSGLMA